MSGFRRAFVSEDLVGLVERASEYVPAPWLYFAEILPASGESEGEGHLTNFVYRVAANFVAQLQHRRGGFTSGEGRTDFSPVILQKRDLAYSYRTIQGATGLLTLHQAFEVLRGVICHQRTRQHTELALRLDQLVRGSTEVVEERVEFYERVFEELQLGPFHSVALAQPFSPGFTEPCYFFRIADSGEELVVGARSGSVRWR
jgi:hypothetical protein